jgi:hypothetical protein
LKNLTALFPSRSAVRARASDGVFIKACPHKKLLRRVRKKKPIAPFCPYFLRQIFNKPKANNASRIFKKNSERRAAQPERADFRDIFLRLSKAVLEGICPDIDGKNAEIDRTIQRPQR